MYKLILSLLLFIPVTLFAHYYTISGYVMQKDNQETLIMAYVTDSLHHQRTVTNQSGFYSISLPEGDNVIKINYLGYKEYITVFKLKSDTIINFYLEEKKESIGEIVISAEVPVHEQTIMGKTMISTDKILKIPSLAGVPDLMKAITTIPGISSGSEGRSNIYVRGGDMGQNLILLDGAKLYNTNHLGGFVSIFNCDIIKQVDVYKCGFPSRYGGRASSVIDITTRDGDRENIHGKASIGILNSSISAEGPIGKKFSFNTSFRTTYYDLFTIKSRIEYPSNSDGNFFGYTFFDANAKLTYYASDYHHIFTNFYMGNDYEQSNSKGLTSSKATEDKTTYNTYNNCVTIGDRLTLSPKLILKNSLIYSHYKNHLATTSTDSVLGGYTSNSVYQSSTSIDEYNLQSRLEYYSSKRHEIKGGVEASNYHFVPGISYSSSRKTGSNYESDTTNGYTSAISANEVAIYAEDDIGINNIFYTNVGIRGVMFSCKGYDYYKLEPRISLRAMLGKNVSFKANYSLMNQFNHVIVTTYGILEKETWVTSTKNIPPQQAQQVSSGFFATIMSSKIELSAEAYYKTMNNLLEYNSLSADDVAITDLEELIIKGGKGKAYGLELQTKYKNGAFTIDANYVLSWNYRQFDELNNGKWYPFLYDRKHQFSILGSCILGKHYSLNTNFVFATGRPYTIPDAYIKTTNSEGFYYYTFSSMNNYRMPNYHRLDVSLVKRELTKHGRIQQFTLNIYNVYARQNPVSIYFENGKLYQTSLFTIVPTISYTLEF